MKCKLTDKEWEDNKTKTISFRQVKERFYAGIWYDKNYWLPVNPNLDKKNLYCIQLSPTISYMVDKDILCDKTYSVNFTKENYIKWVNNDWNKFKLDSNHTYPPIDSLGENQKYLETENGTFIESYMRNVFDDGESYYLYDTETKRTVRVYRPEYLSNYLRAKPMEDVESEMRKQAINLMEKSKKDNNINKNTYETIIL